MKNDTDTDDGRTGGEPERDGLRDRVVSHQEHRERQSGGPALGHEDGGVEKSVTSDDIEAIEKSLADGENPYADGHEALADREGVAKAVREGEAQGLDAGSVRAELEKAGLRPRGGGVSKSAAEAAETGGEGGGSPTGGPEAGDGPEGGEAALIALAADRVIKDLRAAVEDGATDEEWADIDGRLDRLAERTEALDEVTEAEAEALQERSDELVELAERADRARGVPA